MSSPEDIHEQQERLTAHRRTLAHYLKQEAALGSTQTPPGTSHGIREARAEIARIKAVLRGWGVIVEDNPDDAEPVSPTPTTAASSSTSPVPPTPPLPPLPLLAPQVSHPPCQPAQTSLKGNPFTPGLLPPPDRFIGRKRELRTILGRLEQMGSVLLMGDSRIGKSSLLKYLEACLPSLLTETYRPVYVSVDGLVSQASLVKALLRHLLPHIPQGVCPEQVLRALEYASNPTRNDLEDALQYAYRGGIKVVLLLDEFKSMLDRPEQFDEPFLRWMRSLAQGGTLAMIVATRQPLEGIARFDLYFANHITLVVELHEMVPDDAETLLRQPHDHPFTDADVRIGLEAGQNLPLRLQEAGSLLYESKAHLPGDFHRADGSLCPDAGRNLKKRVEKTYRRIKRMSCSSSRPARRWPDPFAALGRGVMTIGDDIGNATARLYGVAVVVLLLTVVGLAIAALTGRISFDDLKTIWNVLTGSG